MTIEYIDIRELTEEEQAELFNPEIPGAAEEGPPACDHKAYVYVDEDKVRCNKCHGALYEIGEGNPNWF